MNSIQTKGIFLGSGLIGIGRKWGHVDSPIPSEAEVLQFLSSAIDLGITYFDTAASYGTSEERLGKFLSSLSSEKRKKLIVATKFGDHLNTQTGEAYVDHSYEALKKSLDNSIHHLGKIDLLYLHKAHLHVLKNPDVAKAFAYATEQGIETFGASVSELDAAAYVLNGDFYSVIQLPYNSANTTFTSVIDRAKDKGKIVVINRPFNMGQHMEDKVEAFTFILQKQFDGFVLTGTKSIKHLEENYEAFHEAKTSSNGN